MLQKMVPLDRLLRSPWMFRSLWALTASFLLVMVVLLSYGAYLTTFLELPRSEDHPPLRLYTAPFQLKAGLSLKAARLLERLQRLGYRAAKDAVTSAGEYRLSDETLTIFLHAQPEAFVKANVVSLEVKDGLVTQVLSEPDRTPVFPVFLEPELISGLRGTSRQVREWIPLSAIPERLIETVLAVEDRRFYSHVGIDPLAVGRAVWRNLTKRGVIQGGSTITQQLAKNLFYSPQRTVVRKVKEALAAIVLESKYAKRDILESYLNEIYLGQAGFVSIYGVGEAAHRYFAKTLDRLTTGEIAMIAGLIKGPNTFAPTKHRELAQQRRDVVLRLLRDQGRISEEEWKIAVNEPVRVVPPDDVLAEAPYFVDTVLRQVEEALGTPLPEGLRIDSTLDSLLQQAATDGLENGLARLERAYPSLKGSEQPLQGAAVVLDPSTGSILALVGGRDYRVSQFNRAVQAHRQAGSLFKPFVYLAAFESSRSGTPPYMTPASLLADEPVTFESENGTWAPQNYDKQFRGSVTLRSALEQSLNVPAVRVAKAVGTQPILDVIRQVGVTAALTNDLSLALGSPTVSLLEMVTAYGTMANGGIWVRPTSLRAASDREGMTVWTASPDRRQAVSPQAAYLVTSLLEGVVRRGTAAKAKALGLTGAIAGKTGTTDGYRDAWFIGYTSELVIGVWIGFDDERALRLTGSQAALPIWMDIARRILPEQAPAFVPPAGVVMRAIDPKTGQLATSQCPEQVDEVFIDGTEPTVYCEVHGGGLWERLRHTFGFS
ncbi:MAG TPA: PBP1A family penicillin-binding protein [Nitrospira sp.]|jgi:penicillin-binding protein 1B|nr:PBP1A family penicillin-binding protein [Nitrospira sp.]